MLKYFELVLELLEISDRGEYLRVAKFMEKNRNKEFFVYHKMYFLFEAFADLLSGQIDETEFVKIGDISSDRKIFSFEKMDSDSFLKSVQSDEISLDENCVYIVDEFAKKLNPDLRIPKNMLFC